MLKKLICLVFLLFIQVAFCSNLFADVRTDQEVYRALSIQNRGLFQTPDQSGTYKSNITVGQRFNPITAHKYEGGLNFTDPNYIASLAFTAATGVIIAVFLAIVIVLFSLVKFCACCCCNEGHCFRTDKRPTTGQGCCRVYFLLCCVFVSLIVLAGIALMFVGAGRTKDADTQIFKYVDTQLKGLEAQLQNVTEEVNTFKSIPIAQDQLQSQLQKIEGPVNDYLKKVQNIDNIVEQQAAPLSSINNALRIVCYVIGGVAIVILIVVFLGFCLRFNSCLMFMVLYVICTLAIITWLQAGFYQLAYSLLTDSCDASLQYIQAPTPAFKDQTDIGQYVKCSDLANTVPLDALQGAKTGINAATTIVNQFLLLGGGGVQGIAQNAIAVIEGAPVQTKGPDAALCQPYNAKTFDLSTCPYPNATDTVKLFAFNQTYQGKIDNTMYTTLAGPINSLANINGSVYFAGELRSCGYVNTILSGYHNQNCEKAMKSILILSVGAYVTGGGFFFLFFNWMFLMPYIYNKRNLYSRQSFHYGDSSAPQQQFISQRRGSKYYPKDSDFPDPYENNSSLMNQQHYGNNGKA